MFCIERRGHTILFIFFMIKTNLTVCREDYLRKKDVSFVRFSLFLLSDMALYSFSLSSQRQCKDQLELELGMKPKA